MNYAIDFWLTTYCQAKCRSCARTDEHTGEEASWLVKEHMKMETFTSRLDGFDEHLEYIQFCGEMGDPCMHPQIEQFVDKAFDYTNDVHVLTNGGLRQPKWYEDLAEKYTNFRGKNTGTFIKFGVDGTDHDTNWLYREGVNWQRAYDNMKAYFGNGGRGSWHFLIFDWNWHQVPEAYEMAKDIGVEINFKFNNRSHGLISVENKRETVKILKDIEYSIGGPV